MMPENWSTLVFTEKLSEVDATNGPNVSDEDRDAYYLGTAYKADFGPTNAALWIIRDARELGANTSPYTSMNLWLNGKYQFDAITFEWEADWGFGEAGVNSLGQDADQKSLALMGDLSFKTLLFR